MKFPMENYRNFWGMFQAFGKKSLKPRDGAKITPPKFNSSPLKTYRNPIGKACLPTTIFQGLAVKLRGCKHVFLDRMVDGPNDFFDNYRP